MRVLAVLVLLGAAACSRAAPAKTSSITIPADFQRVRPAAPALVTRGTINLGSVETGEAVEPLPTGVGGGPPQK